MPNIGNTQQQIDYGAAANDGTGDPLRTAFIKTDENFDNVWLAGPVGSNVTIINNTIGVNNTNGNLILSPNGVGNVQFNRDAVPRLNNTYNLGAANLRWRSLSVGAGGINTTGNLNLSGIANLQIAGGIDGYVIQTDGAGNLTWVAQAGGGPVGPSGAVQINWQDSFSNQGGTPGDTYSTLQFDSNGMPTLDGATAYQQRVDYSPYLQVLAPRVESTDFGIVAGPGVTVVGYDDTYNTPRSAYFSVQDQATATQQWDFGILGYGSNNYSISDRTSGNAWTFGTDGNLTLPANTFAVNYANGDPVVISGGGGAGAAGNAGDIQINVAGNIGADSTLRYVDNGGEMTLYADYLNAPGIFTSDIYAGDGSPSNITLTTSYGNATWTFGSDGSTLFPTLTTQRGDNPSGTIQGQTLLFGDATQEAIISTPDGVAGNEYSQRLVINPGAGYDYGEGGDIYLWAGRGGPTDGSGGDIKIRGGQGMANGTGGYIRIEGGDSQQNGYPGYIDIRGGSGGTTQGAYVRITGGTGATNGGEAGVIGGYGTDVGGDANITAGYGGTNQGGNVNITGGGSALGLAGYGNINVNAGASQWVFNNTGNLTLPGNAFAVNYANGDPVIISGGTANTGNVTFSDQIVIGTGISNLVSGLYLAPSSSSANAVQYLRVRGDTSYEPTHIHFDTGNNQYFNQFIGDDNKYVLLSNIGNIVVRTDDYTGNSAQWTFDATGNLTVPGNIIMTTGIVGSGLASPAPYLSGFSSLSAETLSATGNITVGNLITSGSGGDITLTSGNITGVNNISTGTITLGNGAVLKDNAGNAVAFGPGAGQTSQGNSSVAIGETAGANTQGLQAVAVGVSAGQITQGLQAVAVGGSAGYTDQGLYSVAIGSISGAFSQGNSAVAIGSEAGGNTQGSSAVAVGPAAGYDTQGTYAVAIGAFAGQTNQGLQAVAIGASAGATDQGVYAVAIGAAAGAAGNSAVAIGVSSGFSNQGNFAVAIGASAGATNQGNNSIIINATGTTLDQTTANTLTVAPIRNDNSNIAEVMFYNTSSKEITYGNTISVSGNITAANFFGNGSTLSNVATQVTGTWTVPVGNSTQSFTVSNIGTYSMWVDCNITNGIMVWNATATVTNNNVPVVGAQYAWVYNGGGTPIDFTSIPNQFTGTANTIIRSSTAPSATTNRFDFGINNTSGGNVTVRYGYTRIS